MRRRLAMDDIFPVSAMAAAGSVTMVAASPSKSTAPKLARLLIAVLRFNVLSALFLSFKFGILGEGDGWTQDDGCDDDNDDDDNAFAVRDVVVMEFLNDSGS